MAFGRNYWFDRNFHNLKINTNYRLVVALDFIANLDNNHFINSDIYLCNHIIFINAGKTTHFSCGMILEKIIHQPEACKTKKNLDVPSDKFLPHDELVRKSYFHQFFQSI